MFTALRAVRAPEESARAFVYRILSTYIREMFLRPGEKLVETDVAQELRVSRTPVHDTFARLVREKMLRPAPRGAVVPPLNADAIGQYIWMYRTTCIAVLGELYNNRPASLGRHGTEFPRPVPPDAPAGRRAHVGLPDRLPRRHGPVPDPPRPRRCRGRPGG